MQDTDTAQSQAKAQLEHIKAMVDRLYHVLECNGDDDCGLLNAALLAGLGFVAGYCKESHEQLMEMYHDEDAAHAAIEEHPLSVQVRSGWVDVGTLVTGGMDSAEYEILLCTGGPAVRIRGTLGNHGEPVGARLEYQDWGTPWTEYRNLYHEPAFDVMLVTYAQQFYFGD